MEMEMGLGLGFGLGLDSVCGNRFFDAGTNQ